MKKFILKAKKENKGDFDFKKNYKIHIKKLVLIVCVCIIIIIGVILIKDSIFNSVSTGTGVINMAENNYLYNTQMEYVESKGNFVKIDYIMMDDFNINIVFDIKTKEKLNETYMIEISDLIILDENKNIIFCSYNNDVYKKYCKENKIKYDKDWVEKNYSNNGYQSEIIEKSDNNIKFIYKMRSSGYPKSKELSIRFGNIDIIPTIESVISNEKYKITGNWNLNLKLPQEFYNREIIKYNVEENTDIENGIIIEEIIASHEEMHIDLKVKGAMNSINNTEEDVEKRLLAILNDNESNEIIQDPIVENEKGKIFKVSTVTGEENFSKIYRKNGDLDTHIIFPLTKYDYTDTLKLKMILKGNKICINLKR